MCVTRATKGQPLLANSHATFGRENWYVTTPNSRSELLEVLGGRRGGGVGGDGGRGGGGGLTEDIGWKVEGRRKDSFLERNRGRFTVYHREVSKVTIRVLCNERSLFGAQHHSYETVTSALA